MYENILVPTDGSAGTDAAVERAIDLATAFDSTLHVQYVIETNAMTLDVGLDDLMANFEAIGQEVVDDVYDQAVAAGVDRVERSVEDGSPHRRIVAYVDENDIDLVVMGTHGRTGIERHLLGSVTAKVVRMSPVPVLTVPMADSAAD